MGHLIKDLGGLGRLLVNSGGTAQVHLTITLRSRARFNIKECLRSLPENQRPQTRVRTHLTPAAKTRGDDIRAHFKNTYNVCRALKGMNVLVAQKYLNQVLEHQRCIPYTRYAGATGRTAQAKEFGVTKGRWPQKSVKVVLNLLANLVANAKVKTGIDVDKLVLNHIQVNRAAKGRRRTYRAHGRITPFLSSPCHIEIFATVPGEAVAKEGAKVSAEYKRTVRRAVAAARFRKRVVAGGDKKSA